jgi:hypoxanthine-DNA glycosylase
MSRLEGFPPVAAPGAHTLILGSMPGAASLAAFEYYAHRRNHFWPIIGAVLGIDPALPYEERTRRFAAAGFALWDVLGACRRHGSLDSNIETDSIEVNDFAAFFAAHPAIDRVFCNGTAAEQCFRRHVLPRVDDYIRFELRRLPSTSPANASVPYLAKLAAWQAIAR